MIQHVIHVLYTCVVYLCCILVFYTCVIYLCYILVLYTCVIFLCYILVLYTCVIYLCYILVLYTCVIYLCYIRVGIVLCSDDSQYFIDMQHNETCDKKIYTVHKKWINLFF